MPQRKGIKHHVWSPTGWNWKRKRLVSKCSHCDVQIRRQKMAAVLGCTPYPFGELLTKNVFTEVYFWKRPGDKVWTPSLVVPECVR